MDAQPVRTRLEELLEDLDRLASALTADVATGVDAADSEPRTVERSASDEANNLVDTDREEASLEVIDAQRARVREALERVDAGAYGQCVDCGKPLPEARLEARPEAERCLECQQKHEAIR